MNDQWKKVNLDLDGITNYDNGFLLVLKFHFHWIKLAIGNTIDNLDYWDKPVLGDFRLRK